MQKTLKKHPYTRWIPASVFLYPLSIFAGDFAQTGFTGALRTPTAEVIGYGEMSFGYSAESNITDDTGHQKGAHDSLILGIGLTPGVEFILQNTHKNFSADPGYNQGNKGSDLSFAAKFNSQKYWPDLPVKFALGLQDYGTHNATFHQNYYAVATSSLYDVQISAGVGKGDDRNQMGPDYLNGIFGSLSWSPVDYASVLVEHDGTGVNTGIRLNSADLFKASGWHASLTLQGDSSSQTTNRDNRYIGLAVTKDFGIAQQSHRHSVINGVDSINESGSLGATIQTSPVVTPALKRSNVLKTLNAVAALEFEGFENIQHGMLNGLPVLSFENNVFNRNEAFAIGYVIGKVTEHLSSDFYLVLKNNDLAVSTMRINTALLEQAGQFDYLPVGAISVLNTTAYKTQIQWNKTKVSPSRFKPRLALSPQLRSTFGTEWGVLDYSVALGANLKMDLWPGARLDARYLSDGVNSDDADYNGHPITPYKSAVDRILVHQTWSPTDRVFTQFSAGVIQKDYMGLANETRWESSDGRHRILYRGARYDHQDYDDTFHTPSMLYYRHYLPDRKNGVEIFGGQFWNSDKGLGLRTLHWFGDARISIEVLKSDELHAGLFFNVPLQLKRSMKPKTFQVTGSTDWRWGYRTQLSSNSNAIDNSVADEFRLEHSLDTVFFNRDRLSPGYLHHSPDIIRGINQAKTD